MCFLLLSRYVLLLTVLKGLTKCVFKVPSKQIAPQSAHQINIRLTSEIAVVKQTRARDRTFEGVPDSGCPPVPAGQPRPYLVNFWPNFAKSKPCFGVLYL